MDEATKQWVDDALKKCATAEERQCKILLIRRQDENDQADIAVTNGTPEMVSALALAINGPGE